MLQTSAGAKSNMSPEEVAAIYPGSVIKEEGTLSRKTEIIVADRGYTLSSYLECPPYSFLGPCKHKGIHRIYDPVNGSINEINNKLELNNLSGNRGKKKFYTLVAPESAGQTIIKISKGKGDADLYVKKGSTPTLNSFDCRPYQDGNNETCKFNTPGTYYIMVLGYSSYSSLSLKGFSE
ncbi:MAG: PPC domain-containing protein [Methylococcales bacterium]|nr:PPC domain-containing protein [Methylococcales bacterium]